MKEGLPDFIVKTTGTVTPKKLPICLDMIKDIQSAGQEFVFDYVFKTKKIDVLLDKTLSLLSSSHMTQEGPHYVGEVGGISFHTRPFYLNKKVFPNLKVNSIPGFEERLDAIIDSIIGQNITIIISQPLWLEVLEKRLITKTGKGIRANFPKLKLFLSGGVHLNPFRKRMKQLLGDDVEVLDSYLASEGYMSFQDDPARDDIRLLTNRSIYYEFIDQTTGERHNLETVETNKSYELVVTNTSGLWAQPTGDLIEFSSIDPFRIRILGRKKDFINLATEKVIADEVSKAISSLPLNVVDCTVAPKIQDGKGYYEFFIETEDEVTTSHLIQLDKALGRENFKYLMLRNEDRIHSPVIHVLKIGAFEAALTRIGKLGGQNKVPKVKNSEEFSQHLRGDIISSVGVCKN